MPSQAIRPVLQTERVQIFKADTLLRCRGGQERLGRRLTSRDLLLSSPPLVVLVLVVAVPERLVVVGVDDALGVNAKLAKGALKLVIFVTKFPKERKKAE